MAFDHKAGDSGDICSSVQAKRFRAKIITILFANVELHREKKKKKLDIGSSWFES